MRLYSHFQDQSGYMDIDECFGKQPSNVHDFGRFGGWFVYTQFSGYNHWCTVIIAALKLGRGAISWRNIAPPPGKRKYSTRNPLESLGIEVVRIKLFKILQWAATESEGTDLFVPAFVQWYHTMCYYYDCWRSVTATTTLKQNWMSWTPQGYFKKFLGFKWEHLVHRVMISWFCKLLTSNMSVLTMSRCWNGRLQDDSCCGCLEVFYVLFWVCHILTVHAVLSLPAATCYPSQVLWHVSA